MFLSIQDWKTVDASKFRISANGGRRWSVAEMIEKGSYNMFLEACPIYNGDNQTFESSHKLFKCAFDTGFPWELSEVISGNNLDIFSKDSNILRLKIYVYD